MLAAAVGAREECVFSVQSDRPDCAFDDVGVDLDTAVVEEAGQTLPTRERIADRFSEFCLLTDQSELGAQPGFKFIDNRPAPPQPGVAPFLGAAATERALEGIELGDAFERLAGDRRRTGRGEFVEASAHMGPAECQSRVTALGEYAIAGVAIDLKGAREACEMGDRSLRLAIGGVDIRHARRVGATPAAIVACIGPQLTGLGFSVPWIAQRSS